MARRTTGTRPSRKAKQAEAPAEAVEEVKELEQPVVEESEITSSSSMDVEPAREEASPTMEGSMENEPEPIAEETVVAPEVEAPKPTRKRRSPSKKKEPITQEIELSIPVEPAPVEAEETKVEVPQSEERPTPKKRGGRKKLVKNVVTQARSRFGWCEINGVRHEHDLIIKADGTVERRDKSLSKGKKEKYGHVPLTRKELKKVLDGEVKLVFIGTGQSGGMPLTPKASKMLEDMGAVVKPTPDVLEDILAAKERYVALLHVTC